MNPLGGAGGDPISLLNVDSYSLWMKELSESGAGEWVEVCLWALEERQCPSETGIDLFSSLLLTFSFCKNKIIQHKPSVKDFVYSFMTFLLILWLLTCITVILEYLLSPVIKYYWQHYATYGIILTTLSLYHSNLKGISFYCSMIICNI